MIAREAFNAEGFDNAGRLRAFAERWDGDKNRQA
jgi:hypothetical protein